ncbi:hypothetical protein [Halovenus sp. HT40]|uniref:hypothetical protein n=1 Tax=Halovenus sp. HT40 TaxID=3126691 RepID=UPI00300F7221
MISPSSVLFFLIVGCLAVGLSGLIGNSVTPTSRSDATVLAVLVIIGAIGAFGLVTAPSSEYEYRVTTADDCANNDYVQDYDDLSPREQEVFDAAVAADNTDPHTTNRNPGFTLGTDTGGDNCIQKNGQSYRLFVEQLSPRSLLATLMFLVMFMIGSLSALLHGFLLIERQLPAQTRR